MANANIAERFTMTIKLKGVIGWDVIGYDFAEMISRLHGDIELEIDSPGGLISDGISIANAIRDYNKGKVLGKVVGQACSMTSYIMLFCDELFFEPNATVMIHEPYGQYVGNAKTLLKGIEKLNKYSDVMALEYSKHNFGTFEECKALMEAETWFIGEEDLAKIGKIVQHEGGNEPKQDIKKLKEKAMSDILNWQNLFSFNFEKQKIAALGTPIKGENNKKVLSINQGKEKIMDLNELQTQYPEVFEQAKAIGKKEEQARVNSHLKFIDIAKDVAVNAIQSGKTISDPELQSEYLMANFKSQTVKQMEKDSPQALNAKIQTESPNTKIQDEYSLVKEQLNEITGE